MLELEETSIWSPIILRTIHRSLTLVMPHGTGSTPAVSPVKGPYISLCSLFYCIIAPPNFFLIFITVLPFCSSHPLLLFSCPCLLMREVWSFYSVGQLNLLKLLSRKFSPLWCLGWNRTRCLDMYLNLLNMQMQFEISVLKMLLAAFQGRS